MILKVRRTKTKHNDLRIRMTVRDECSCQVLVVYSDDVSSEDMVEIGGVIGTRDEWRKVLLPVLSDGHKTWGEVKVERLKAKGWRYGDADEFLDATSEDKPGNGKVTVSRKK